MMEFLATLLGVSLSPVKIVGAGVAAIGIRNPYLSAAAAVAVALAETWLVMPGDHPRAVQLLEAAFVGGLILWAIFRFGWPLLRRALAIKEPA